jgi:hypothetical protein
MQVTATATDAAGHASQASAAASVVDPSGGLDLPGWHLDMNEEFTSPTLDPTRWKAFTGAVGTDTCFNVPDCVKVVDGQLVFTPRLGRHVLPSGEVRTVESAYLNPPPLANVPKYTLPSYFRLEFRIRNSMAKGCWCAGVWLRRVDLWGAAEIDPLETYADKPTEFGITCHAGASYSKPEHQMKQVHLYTTDPRIKNKNLADWHTVTMEKTPGQIAFWVDGVPSQVVNAGNLSGFAAAYEDGARWFLKSCLEIGRATPAPDPGQTDFGSMAIDYIRTWLPTN